MAIVTRFAPSPTGYLHLGHAFSALTAWRAARAVGGRFVLRLEDIDRTRCRAEYAAAIFEDLAWLGLDWDGEVRVQSDHLADYRATLADLQARGLVYPCFCTRADIALSTSAPHGGEPTYPGTCRRLPPDQRAARIADGQPFALRLDVARARALVGELSYDESGQGRVVCHPARVGDVVLARKDAPASYHLCVAHDDALQGVSLVTRAVDLRPMTDIHRLLQAVMGWPQPAYAHHPLVLDDAGRRLAKRHGAPRLRDLRAGGASAADLVAAVMAAARP